MLCACINLHVRVYIFQNLLLELKNFEVTQRIGKSQDPHLEISRMGESMGVIPAATQIKTEFIAEIGDDKSSV